MSVYSYATLAPQIRASISARVQAGRFNPDTILQIIEGFVYMPVQQNVGGPNYQIGGPAIPMVAAVGNITGKVYYFPLLELVHGLDLS